MHYLQPQKRMHSATLVTRTLHLGIFRLISPCPALITLASSLHHRPHLDNLPELLSVAADRRSSRNLQLVFMSIPILLHEFSKISIFFTIFNDFMIVWIQ
jgi:hypothetical protein